MIIAAGVVRVIWMKRLLNIFMREGSIPEEWRTVLIVPILKGKVGVQDPGKCRGITLLSCNEGAGQDSGQEKKEEGRDGDRRRAARV